MIKCELAELLPHLDKVLFLDGDILVMGDLGELYDIDLGSNIVAAMRELLIERRGGIISSGPLITSTQA